MFLYYQIFYESQGVLIMHDVIGVGRELVRVTIKDIIVLVTDLNESLFFADNRAGEGMFKIPIFWMSINSLSNGKIVEIFIFWISINRLPNVKRIKIYLCRSFQFTHVNNCFFQNCIGTTRKQSI